MCKKVLGNYIIEVIITVLSHYCIVETGYMERILKSVHLILMYATWVIINILRKHEKFKRRTFKNYISNYKGIRYVTFEEANTSFILLYIFLRKVSPGLRIIKCYIAPIIKSLRYVYCAI